MGHRYEYTDIKADKMEYVFLILEFIMIVLIGSTIVIGCTLVGVILALLMWFLVNHTWFGFIFVAVSVCFVFGCLWTNTIGNRWWRG